jgi:geranyl-CoA carboxylase alpha subunit
MNQTTFKKVLIANRGEIALRLMRTAKAKGLYTIAIYSEADVDAPHTRFADEAWLIGGAAPKDSYLNIENIIDVAHKSGAQAIHPGYGFLAENAVFARTCNEAGFIFIGPSANAIAVMGDKAKAKQLMRAAGVPCIDGYDGHEQSADALTPIAELIGFPLMIKAAAGGGGRGMRLVHKSADFSGLLASAQSEALNSFGDGTVLLEKAITKPRHIEIQVVADKFGNVIHLGERDCSIQRRHQKIIEEAPSPAVNEALRNEMGAIAVKACQSIHYEGVGTFEFLLDENAKFYFMEMNTRLQVEHPVTEAITGLDLVAMQFDIAIGMPLALTQDQVTFSGHAIEVRLCAEDVDANFQPQSGELLNWNPPVLLRVEHALERGSHITPFYDSMIAKMISHGDTRQAACDQMTQGLTELAALGIPTNQDFLSACINHPQFENGKFNTGFIEQHLSVLVGSPLVSNVQTTQMPSSAVVAAALLFSLNSKTKQQLLPHPYPVSIKFLMASLQHATVLQTKTGLQISCNDTSVGISLRIDTNSEAQATIQVGQCSFRVHYAKRGDHLYIRYAGQNFTAIDQRYLASKSSKTDANDGICRASTNGRVVSMLAVGSLVEIGQALVTLEAMKMEHVHISKIQGIVESIGASVGDQVKQWQALVTVKPKVAAKA